MNVADADEYWYCHGCHEQFDTDVYDEGECPRPYCDNSAETTLTDFAGGGA